MKTLSKIPGKSKRRISIHSQKSFTKATKHRNPRGRQSIDERIDKLIAAFDKDSYTVDKNADVRLKNNFIGIRATHKTAVIGNSGVKKKTFYIEGNPYSMGYLMGLLSESDVSLMCTEFNQQIVWAFLKLPDLDLFKLLQSIISDLCQKIIPDVPKRFVDELRGIVDGCQKANANTRVTLDSLWILNVGIDALLAYIYTGTFPLEIQKTLKIKFGGRNPKQQRQLKAVRNPTNFKVPLMCNGFAISGKDKGNVPFSLMGRDFMFATAGVFQQTATMIIRKPAVGFASVSVAAPGMIGTIAGVNSEGVGVGVDMNPAANCNTEHPGVNSLILTRWSIEDGDTCKSAKNVMVEAPRGVAWAYILADSTSSCVVEAGMSTAKLDFWSYPDDWAKRSILWVDEDFQKKLAKPSVPVEKGLMTRWNDYVVPSRYDIPLLDATLIQDYAFRNPSYDYQFDFNDFGGSGKLDQSWTDRNCPGPYYFAPQRTPLPSGILETNHSILPEMRLCAMTNWIAIIAKDSVDDIQWRYDELHQELKERIAKGFVDQADVKNAVKAIISFLNPGGKFDAYYNVKHDPSPYFNVQIEGSISVIDLRKSTIDSHYGYYSDDWITLSLGEYIK